MSQTEIRSPLVVIGGGPGGYPAAFFAADMGLEVTLVDMEQNPGGVCLYRGCIPSKALLHVARVINESREAADWGVTFEEPRIDLAKMRAWKDKVIQKLTGGLGLLSKKRRIRYIRGKASFVNSQTIRVTGSDGSESIVSFDHAVIASGSTPVLPTTLAISSAQVMDSTSALRIADIPKTLLVIGGGYIGCELGSVYAALGSQVTMAEAGSGLAPGADRDLADVLSASLRRRFSKILLKTKVASLQEINGKIRARFEGLHLPQQQEDYEGVLLALGRRPNSRDLGLENTAVEVDGKGFIKVDPQRRTADRRIFAVGDVAGEPMLAHKASHEGRTAVAAILGQPAAFDPRAIPAVIFTDPELAWCGLTELKARERSIEVKIVSFPWAASGRATTLDRTEGLTKLILEPHSEQVLGVGIVGIGAGEMIAEGVLAVEMAARASDLRMTIHAHPTLSETMMEAAEIFFGQATHSLSGAKHGPA